MKGSVNLPSPFDDTAFSRQVRMGLLQTDGVPNMEALETMARVYAALFFENLCDTGADMEKVVHICGSLAQQQKTEDTKQLLLTICMQYDAMLRPLPEPVWWIVGNPKLVEPFVRSFVQALAGFAHTPCGGEKQ